MPAHKADAIGIFGGSKAELCFLEQSSGPGAAEGQHFLDDSVKLANENAQLREFLDAPVDDAKKVKIFALQLINKVHREFHYVHVLG
ncbi:hypothetical protein HDU90_005179 [Geranomyces variabilis]|nr:hypothetical protein HDU90_005179 [Geranomyces variabilis]